MAFANLTKKQRDEVLADLAKISATQKKMDESSGDYYKIIKQIRDVQKDISKITTAALHQQTKTNTAAAALIAAQATGNAAAIAAAKNRHDIEEAVLELLLKEKQALVDINKELVTQAKNCNIVTGVLKTGLKDLVATKKALTKLYDKLQIADIFKMSKSIKTSALSMGVLTSQADSFSKDIQAAALDTIEFGTGIEDIAKIQSTYSEELGRTVMLGVKGAKGLGEMASATGLGAEGAGAMAASLDVVGLSAERTADYVNQVMNDSHAMGLNSSKVIKNIQSNIKLLNRYNFKKGIQGLAAIAESTTKMGVSMEMVAPMADKLFDIEGAVEMSAQLQVLGGEWSKLADPFKLMYMARNDMEGLTDAVINATASTAQFNKKTQGFDISALEMQRLRKVADATGLSFEELAQSAKQAAKFASVKKQMNFAMDDKTEKFIEATSTFDENGKAQIIVDGSNKYLTALSENDKATLIRTAAEKEDMKTRAKEAVTLDEMLGNTITMLKQMAIPFVDALNKSLKPMVDDFVKTIKSPTFQGILKAVVEGLGKFVVGVAKFIYDFPKAALGLFLLFETAKWVASGVALGVGFNSVANGGGGGGGLGRAGSFLGTKGGGALGGLMVGGMNAATAGSMGEGIGNVVGGVVGGVLGSFFGPLGTMLGSQLGSMAGGWIGKPDAGNEKKAQGVNDGIINFNPNDKFMKVNDGTMIAGTNENGNKDLAKVLNSGVPQLPNKEALMSSKQSGVATSSVPSNIPSSMNITFGEIKFAGSIELTNGQGVTTDITKQLLNSPTFVRDMSKMVHIETARAVDGAFKAGPKK